jgi:N-acetylglutamate synthase-like GNAT family acetyltransferase
VSDPLRYIVDLQRKNYEALGFIPQPRTEEYLKRGQVLMAEENGELCGFLVYGMGWPTMKVYQACIQYDARRRDQGLALVARLIARASRSGHSQITLWCADDLDSNAFWKAAGFAFGGQREGGKKRGRKHNLWIYRLPDALTLDAPSEAA